jgi:hypothetical protein
MPMPSILKKALNGTTALVAVGLAAGQASAGSGIKLGISGYYRASAGVLVGGDQTATAGGGGLGDFGRTSGGFRQEIRINFKGEAALDNGITVGVLVGLNPGGTQGIAQLNTGYVEFKGKYGDLRFGTGTGTGSQLDALALTCVYDPGNVTSNFGVNSANQDFTNAGLGRTVGGAGKTVGVATFETAAATCATMTGHSTGLVYFSPTFGGFSFDVSYTPEANTANSSGSQGFGAGTDLKNKTAENILSLGADYNHDFLYCPHQGRRWTAARPQAFPIQPRLPSGDSGRLDGRGCGRLLCELSQSGFLLPCIHRRRHERRRWLGRGRGRQLYDRCRLPGPGGHLRPLSGPSGCAERGS